MTNPLEIYCPDCEGTKFNEVRSRYQDEEFYVCLSCGWTGSMEQRRVQLEGEGTQDEENKIN